MMMKNLKQLGALFLTMALALVLAVPAFAAVGDTGFSDVDANAWYAEAVMYCKEHNLMAGPGNNQFAPESNLTRAQLATVLYRIEGIPAVTGTDAFTDTPDGAWYGDAVLWASQQELISGYGGGLFGPNDPVTREQMTTIFWRYAGSPTAGEASNYTDNASIAAYAVSAVNWASANNIVRPVSSGTFAPKSNATRAQVADALMNYDRTKQTAPALGTAPSNRAKVLVAYFSGTGTTRGVAQNIVNGLGSDVAVLHEITPEQPYTAADLDYTNSNCRSVTEQHDPNARPAIANHVTNMSDYDIVFLGYPIWNNDAPRIIYTFLESENLSGKTIVPFCTSGGSGIANSVSNIRGLASGATWMEGRRCSSSDTSSTLASWANGLGLDFTPTSAPSSTPVTAPDTSNETKVLVAYFSATNTTKPLAEYIADGLDADLYEIVPETPYTSADLNYGNSSSRTSVEMNDSNARPAISGNVNNMEQYDIVFIGYPIWWGQAPRIVRTFFESYDFSGKTIVPFCTSGSSGIGSSATNLHNLTNGANWLNGQRFSGGTSRGTMIQWVNGLGLDITAE